MKSRISVATLLRAGVVCALAVGWLLTRSATGAAASLCGTPGYGQGGIPVVDSVSPNRGVADMMVTVTGCGFTGATATDFGFYMANGWSINSDTQITARVPWGPAGAVDVTVTTPFGTSPIQSGDQFTYVTPGPCTGPLTLTASPPSPQTAGTPVTFTANASGCPTFPEYEFWMRGASSPNWLLVQYYSTNNVLTWNISSTAGDWYVAVWVKDFSSAGVGGCLPLPYDHGGLTCFDRGTAVLYTVKPAACSGPLTVSAGPASPQNAGTQVTFTASVNNCSNPSPIYAFWMRAAASRTWTWVQGYSTSNTFTWRTTGLAGTYYIGVWARDSASATPDFDQNASVAYTINAAVCQGPITLTANPASPQKPNTTVTFTAVVSGCTDLAPLYEFWVRYTNPLWDPAWRLVQQYSTDNAFQWTTPSPAGSLVYVGVWVKDVNSGTADSDVNTSIPYLAVSGGVCTGPVSLSASPSPPQVDGTDVTFTAGATGCANPSPLYQFWLRTGSPGTWQPMGGYGPSNVLVWKTSDWTYSIYRPPPYYIGVWVKDALSATATFDANASMPYDVIPARCSSVTLVAAPPSPSIAGQVVTLTATSTCPIPNPLYQFWVRPASDPTWVAQGPYGPANTDTWQTYGANGASRNYYLAVWVKDAYSQAIVDAYTAVTYHVDPATCSSVSLTAAPSSPQTAGTVVTFTASASGCSNTNPQCQFWSRAASSNTWNSEPNATSNTFVWNTNRTSGDYYIAVWARDWASVNQFDAKDTVLYHINPAVCSAVTVSAAPASPQTSGTSVTFTATGTCPNANPLYQFSASSLLRQAYSTRNTFVWDTRFLAGDYDITVSVRDAASLNATDQSATVVYHVNLASCSSVTLSVAPTTAPQGSTARFVATATPGMCTDPNPQLEFWTRPANSSTWTLAQSGGTINMFNWDLTTAAPGTYYIKVGIRDSASANYPYDATDTTSVMVT